jgi:hypothetical protein
VNNPLRDTSKTGYPSMDEDEQNHASGDGNQSGKATAPPAKSTSAPASKAISRSATTGDRSCRTAESAWRERVAALKRSKSCLRPLWKNFELGESLDVCLPIFPMHGILLPLQGIR